MHIYLPPLSSLTHTHTPSLLPPHMHPPPSHSVSMTSAGCVWTSGGSTILPLADTLSRHTQTLSDAQPTIPITSPLPPPLPSLLLFPPSSSSLPPPLPSSPFPPLPSLRCNRYNARKKAEEMLHKRRDEVLQMTLHFCLTVFISPHTLTHILTHSHSHTHTHTLTHILTPGDEWLR